MTYFGRLKGLDRHAAKTWSLEYLERVALADKANVQLDKLSGGQQQKVQLGVTIMNEPELLILDEPTKGFDPVNRRLLMDIIDGQKTKGATVAMVPAGRGITWHSTIPQQGLRRALTEGVQIQG